ncbi:MAG: hypothetical protein EZS28_044942 [Streblomastix strix]|uniref:Uncharacterized protein n=1 Tax=Streblomastix strix TaxID=222440 RepID=A0A5J4TQ42_9EUKA|nr:MAG: hypothetical protein EZS28_044942 [Streblomastix strix]
MGSMGPRKFTKYRQTKQIQKCKPDSELVEDFEESQYRQSADSDGRKPKYQLIKEKDDEIMGQGQGGEKYDWGIDLEGYDVCEEVETLLKIDVDITSDEYKESVKRRKRKSCIHKTIPPIIARAAGIPRTQEIIQIPPLWSAKVDPQREKDILIELLDNEKKNINIKQGNSNSTTNTTSAPIGSLITNQPGSIIPPVPGNLHATEYPASFISVTPSTHHSLFVIPTPFRPPALALYIEKVPGVILNIDREKRELMLADGSLRMIYKQMFQMERSQRMMKLMLSDFRDSFTNQHKFVYRNGFKDENEIGVIYGASLRAYSVLHGLLQAGFSHQ